MQLELQVALNFVMSYLYNKLPRRRVNIFGEELEKALKAKFDGHWYIEKPCRGSAFRCLKTSNPVDPVLVIAARESGMDLADIREHLPQDMSVWIDPGEVSYRIGEKGQIKLLMSEKKSLAAFEELALQIERDGRPVTVAASVFSAAEAQAFKPAPQVAASNVADLAASLATLRVATPAATTQKQQQQQVFTTAAFAQTKFGSTKLKNSSKRPNRMSPTEFSHYIKQRALVQQQQRARQMVVPVPVGLQQQQHGSSSPVRNYYQQQQLQGQQRPRSLSPGFGPPQDYMAPYMSQDLVKPPGVGNGISIFPDTTGLWQPPTANDLMGGFSSNSSTGSVTPPLVGPAGPQNGGYMDQNGYDYDNWGSGNSSNNYQHLLVAN